MNNKITLVLLLFINLAYLSNATAFFGYTPPTQDHSSIDLASDFTAEEYDEQYREEEQTTWVGPAYHFATNAHPRATLALGAAGAASVYLAYRYNRHDSDQAETLDADFVDRYKKFKLFLALQKALSERK